MNTMTVEGYRAKIEYDEEIDLSRGEILWLSDGTPVVAHRQAQTEPESGPGVGIWTVAPSGSWLRHSQSCTSGAMAARAGSTWRCAIARQVAWSMYVSS